jgi:3-hydroxybutyryl-CoA dehydrogenase
MRIAVIGAGVQGRAFALACARAGHTVVLEDVMPHKLRQAGLELAALDASVRFAATVEDAVSDADFVVDFVPDELESKLEIWALIDRMAPPRSVLCTPSEDLSITDLASCTYRADRCVMVRGALRGAGEVRVLAARATSEHTLSATEELFVSLGQKVMVEADPDLPQLLKNMHAAAL